MRKGIAIHTILLLVVGLIVAGIIIYLAYRTFSGSALGQEECRSMAISWCTGCWNAMKSAGSDCDGWSGTGCDVGPDPSDELETCANSYYGAGWTSKANCEDEKDFCSIFIPI